jgi:hypothetical protein
VIGILVADRDMGRMAVEVETDRLADGGRGPSAESVRSGWRKELTER